MAVTVDMWVELIRETEATRTSMEGQLAEAEAQVATLTQRVQELREEEKSLRSAMARRYPEAARQIAEPAEAIAAAPGFAPVIPEKSWVSMARTDAVERAIQELYRATRLPAAPGEIEAHLSRHGRTDNRDEIGGATARLNKVGRIHSLGRGKWVPGPAPEKTPGDTAATVSPGGVPTEWPGGEHGQATSPKEEALPDGHDQTFSGRNDRDNDWVEASQ